MNPIKQFAHAVGNPTATISRVVTRPNTVGRNRPFYGLNVLDMIRGGTLDDAVRNRIVLITGASSGIEPQPPCRSAPSVAKSCWLPAAATTSTWWPSRCATLAGPRMSTRATCRT